MATDQPIVDPLFGDNPDMAVAPSGAVIQDPLFGPGVERAPLVSSTLARDLPEITNSPRIDYIKSAITGKTPEEGGDFIASFLASAGFLSASDQDERAKILTKQFPDAFEILEDAEGNLVARSDQGSFALNKPGISTSDVTSFVFRTIANWPAGKSISAAKTLGGQLASRAGQVAVKSGAVESALQLLEKLTGGNFDASEVGIATATGGVSEGFVGIPQARSAIKDLAPEVIDQAAEVTSRTGIRLSRAQQTVDPYLLEEQSFIGQMPEGARPAVNFLKQQNEEAANAVRGLLDDFGTPQSVVVGPNKVRTMANKAIALKEAVRSEKASPLYKKAFREFEGELDVSDIVADIDSRIAGYPTRHPAAITLKSYKKDIIENANSLERLQGAKEVADVKLANLSQKPGSASRKAAYELAEVQKSLLNKMDEASPAFAEARDVFARESAPVDAIRASIVGKVADIKDTQLKRVASAIFDPAETNPEVVRQARKAITSIEGGAVAWDEIVRTELERRLGSVRADIGDGVLSGETVENLPSQFRRALFPNKKSKSVLMAGLDQEQREAVNFLDDALRRASLGRPGGSQTAMREEIRARFDRGFVSAMRRFIREPISTFADIGEEAKRSADIQAVAESVFSPDWATEVNRIRRSAGDQEQRFYDLFAQISNSLVQASRANIEQSESQ